MEIPYIVEPRKDTGLNNSKIGIWLFLASEVMLFGGLFSAYIFLRVYADYPWPERTLPILPGLINTFVLIGSSITVVFAWVSLKLRKWRSFQIYMSITILCAVAFMVLKGLEYNAKFHHQAIRLDDYTVIEGHAHAQDHSHDPKAPKKNLNITASLIDIDILRVDDAYYEELKGQYEGNFELAGDLTLSDGTVIKKGEPITKDLLDQANEDYLAVTAHNSNIDIELGRKSWKDIKKLHPGVKYYEKVGDKTLRALNNEYLKNLKEERSADYKKFNPKDAATVRKIVQFAASNDAVKISINPSWGKLSNPKKGEKGNLKLKDQTVIHGTTADSSITLAVDGIDFRHTVMKAVDKGIDPSAAIANSWLLKDEGMALIWKKHKLVTTKLAEQLKAKNREPNDGDIYRVNWQEIAGLKDTSLADLEGMNYEEIQALFPGDLEGFTGPNHKSVHYPEITVPREQVRFESIFSPRWNTYYATYFTITGLHGLHVIAGAFVLGYYLFFGRKMYEENPEWLANRVEVGGLFWHFVDLVWIFLFPILYLM